MPRRKKASKRTYEKPTKGLREIYGTLPDWAIQEYIEKGIIKISPLPLNWKENINSVTIDFHLGEEVLVPKTGENWYVDVKVGVDDSHYEKIKLEEGQTHIMEPNQFIIAPTVEKLELPTDILGRLEGKSSLARLGIVVHLTSGRFDPGWNGKPVLELKNNSHVPVLIYGGWPVCAFSFERLMARVESPYTDKGRYVGATIHSLVHHDNNKN